MMLEARLRLLKSLVAEHKALYIDTMNRIAEITRDRIRARKAIVGAFLEHSPNGDITGDMQACVERLDRYFLREGTRDVSLFNDGIEESVVVCDIEAAMSKTEPRFNCATTAIDGYTKAFFYSITDNNDRYYQTVVCNALSLSLRDTYDIGIIRQTYDLSKDLLPVSVVDEALNITDKRLKTLKMFNNDVKIFGRALTTTMESMADAHVVLVNGDSSGLDESDDMNDFIAACHVLISVLTARLTMFQ